MHYACLVEEVQSQECHEQSLLKQRLVESLFGKFVPQCSGCHAQGSKSQALVVPGIMFQLEVVNCDSSALSSWVLSLN